MNHQSEAQLENELIKRLIELGYEPTKISDGEALVSNLKKKLEAFNKTTYSDKEFKGILNHLEKGNVFEKAKTLRDRFSFERENGSIAYVRFFNSDNWNENLFQVTNQITQEGRYKNRYDVTLLINGIPLVQIELKRRGLEIKEAFNQINRYQKHTFWSNHGLFQYVQLFIISNGVNTKYLANNELQSVKQTFFWADKNNKIISDLFDFTNAFLIPDHLGKMIAKYIVMNETHKILMVLRPYQYFATEALINQVKTSKDNAYIWHTTGSGKTLTSFKSSQIIMDIPEVYKVVFVVDRKDLDYQTMKEFNSFKDGSVDSTDNTKSLVDQFLGKFKDKKGVAKDSDLIITTIQKFNNAISGHYRNQLEHLKNERFVFIFDECHRSQFGETHKRITEFFTNSQLFGFTGTPIFADNASKNDLGKRTTKDLFGECLHKYVITDAIRDENVLRFGIEYYSVFKHNNKPQFDEMVEDINTEEVFNDSQYLEGVANHIIQTHNRKTFDKEYSALFAVSSIDAAIAYYDLFKQKKEAGEHDLRITSIFTFGANEDSEEAQDFLPDEYSIAAEPKLAYQSSHTRDKLDEIISDYNQIYGTKFSTRDSQEFQNYFKDISKRLKEREKKNFNDEKDRLDLVIVVNMMLTGFDAKKVNTLYVDKNLKQHGLIQAFSRTNRTLGDKKSQGNILCFRNLKKATDDAITLFSNKEAIEVVLMPEYEDIVKKFEAALIDLKELVPSYQDVNELETETEEEAFVKIFRRVLRSLNVLQSMSDFNWEDLGIDEQEFEDYKSKYLDLYEKVKRDNQKEKVSILDDIDFEIELVHQDKINRAYILKLLKEFKEEKVVGKAEAKRKAIMDLLGGEITLRSKRELIERFIEKHLPFIHDVDKIGDEFEQYWQDEKVLALNKLCEEENLDQKQFQSLIEAYIYSGQEPIKDDILKCLDNRPSILQAARVGERILEKMRSHIETFVYGMVG